MNPLKSSVLSWWFVHNIINIVKIERLLFIAIVPVRFDFGVVRSRATPGERNVRPLTLEGSPPWSEVDDDVRGYLCIVLNRAHSKADQWNSWIGRSLVRRS